MVTLIFAFEQSQATGYENAERYRFKNIYLPTKYHREMSVKGKKVISL